MEKKNTKNWIALLTILDIPRTKTSQDNMVKWLRKIASEIKKEDPDIFAEPCKFRLMK